MDRYNEYKCIPKVEYHTHLKSTLEYSYYVNFLYKRGLGDRVFFYEENNKLFVDFTSQPKKHYWRYIENKKVFDEKI